MRLLVAALLGMFLVGCGHSMKSMETSRHDNHTHEHSKTCGHKAVKHGAHFDFVHDDHYHHSHEGHVDEHGHVDTTRSTASGTEHMWHQNHGDHKHGKKCGHDRVKHGKHFDYIHAGHYHAAHSDHFDNHGVMD